MRLSAVDTVQLFAAAVGYSFSETSSDFNPVYGAPGRSGIQAAHLGLLRIGD